MFTYACICVYRCMYRNICISIPDNTSMCVHFYECVYLCIYTYVCMYVYIYMGDYVCIVGMLLTTRERSWVQSSSVFLRERGQWSAPREICQEHTDLSDNDDSAPEIRHSWGMGWGCKGSNGERKSCLLKSDSGHTLSLQTLLFF